MNTEQKEIYINSLQKDQDQNILLILSSASGYYIIHTSGLLIKDFEIFLMNYVCIFILGYFTGKFVKNFNLINKLLYHDSHRNIN
jgi:hypothetical protein